jgi:hypothetical protein
MKTNPRKRQDKKEGDCDLTSGSEGKIEENERRVEGPEWINEVKKVKSTGISE